MRKAQLSGKRAEVPKGMQDEFYTTREQSIDHLIKCKQFHNIYKMPVNDFIRETLKNFPPITSRRDRYYDGYCALGFNNSPCCDFSNYAVYILTANACLVPTQGDETTRRKRILRQYKQRGLSTSKIVIEKRKNN